MAKKKDQKTKSVEIKKAKSPEINPELKSPEKTLKSRGTFWVNERENGKWRVLFQNWSNGKKEKTETIPKAMYKEIGLKPEMSVDEAKQAITDYNKIRKKDIKITQSQIKALKRIQELKEYDKTIFPPHLVSEFISRLRSRSEGKDRFKNRLVRNFEIVQEMCVELNLLPHDYEPNLDKITNYFKDEKRQYSVSYSEDILWVLNKWGHFYSRHRKTFFEPIGRLKNKTRKNIKAENKKVTGQPSADASYDFLKELLECCPFPIIEIQTDNDTAFTDRFSSRIGVTGEHLMDQWCKAHGINHRLIPVGEKELNGKVENTHKQDDREFFARGPYKSFESLSLNSSGYNDRWNSQRRTKTLGFLSPNETIEKSYVLAIAYLLCYQNEKNTGLHKLDACGNTFLPINKPKPKKKNKTRKLSTVDRYLLYLEWLENKKFSSIYLTPTMSSSFSV